MIYSLGELAERLEGRATAEPERQVSGLATLREAGPRDLSFLTHARYLEAARQTRAGAILVGSDPPELSQPLLVVAEPYDALARLLTLFYPEEPPSPGVHSTAVVDPSAELEAGVSLGPFVVVGAETRIGRGTTVGAGTVIGAACELGAGCRLYPRVVLYDGTVVGAGSILHAGCVIGSDGFGFATSSSGEHRKLQHVGRVVIEEDVEIGANTTIDRGLLAETRIGAGSKIDNLVQVAHNVEIGAGSLLAAQAGIAGSSRLGKGVMMAGQSGVVDHLELADGVQVAAKSAVLQSVEEAGPVAGIPAVTASRWRRQQAWVRRLDELGRRLRRLERTVRDQDGEGDEREQS